MQLRKLGTTGIDIVPLVLGGNVFGWTADREASFAILDAFLEAGFNAIDTADAYSIFVPGHKGGESEEVLGEWMQSRGVRDRMVIVTKLGMKMGEGMEGLSPAYIRRACEASLRRLRTDYIDVYMAHRSDPAVPIEETLEAFDDLIREGKIRHAGASNYAAAELDEAILAGGHGRARYEVFQPHYNLARRDLYEGDLEDLCARSGLGVIPYFALAAGFLTGKYRSKADIAGSARIQLAGPYLNERGFALLDAMELVAKRHKATLAQVAIAWVAARPSVTAPIASATSLTQLADILKAAQLRLTTEDMAQLEPHHV